MNDLFRMFTIRAPEPVDPGQAVVRIPAGAPTSFQQNLAELRASAALPAPAPSRSGQSPYALPQDLVPHPLPQDLMWRSAEERIGRLRDLPDPLRSDLAIRLDRLGTALEALPDSAPLQAIADAIATVLGETAVQAMASQDFRSEIQVLEDVVVATILAPDTSPFSLHAAARLMRVAAIVARVADQDSSLSNPGALAAALQAPILLPSAIFPVHPEMYRPMNVADDLVVRQHIRGYDLGEIAYVENILTGEIRKYATKHALSTEQASLFQTETTTESLKDQQTTDRFDLKSEVDSTLKEDLSVKGAVSVRYSLAPWTVTANADVAYSQSKSQATKVASDQARDVVQRASTKVTQRVLQQQSTKVTETTEEDEDHSFDNTGPGAQNVAGVYQWVNKVYQVQIFNIGARAIFDIMVPEPAALLWDILSLPPPADAPQKPPDFTALPSELDANSIGGYLNKYGVTGVPGPPPATTTVSAAYNDVSQSDDANDNLTRSGTLQISDGYEARSATVTAGYNYKRTTSSLEVVIGKTAFDFTDESVPGSHQRGQPLTLTLQGERDSLAVAIETKEVKDYTVAIDVTCSLSAEKLAAWQLQAHDAIMQAYLQRLKDYQEKMAALVMQSTPTSTPHGTNPDANRLVERTELKRSVISLLAGPKIDLLKFGAIVPAAAPVPAPGAHFPHPDPARAFADGRVARFFEEALEWENMNYVLYPYYWGQSREWYTRVQARDDDPLFQAFLQAGQARVVVPIRHGFEDDVRFFQITGGRLWQGKPLPDVHDADYLPIAMEIKASQDPDVGSPGDSWEVAIPTNQVYLRGDGSLPQWNVSPTWKWSPAPPLVPGELTDEVVG